MDLPRASMVEGLGKNTRGANGSYLPLFSCLCLRHEKHNRDTAQLL